nr:tetrahydrofolate dehydrogenase/cyclohydrolase catalytic domain-containing protein [Candidatus Moranbacteria bacterium]
MIATIIDGKKMAREMSRELKGEVERLKKKGIIPGLAVVLVGEDPASQIYVKNKEKTAEELGIKSQVHKLEEKTTQKELADLIDKLNGDIGIHGILVQLPLPKHIDEEAVLEAISVKKDVDCFHPFNFGKMAMGKGNFLPCTPAGIIEMLTRSHIEISGANAVIVGRSNIVGKPMAA